MAPTVSPRAAHLDPWRGDPVSSPRPVSFRWAAYCREQAVEVLATRSARGQMSCDARVTLRRRGIGGCQFGVHVQQFHRLSASHIARVGPQEAVESCPAVHECLEVSSSRYPLAARAARSLRLASNIVL